MRLLALEIPAEIPAAGYFTLHNTSRKPVALTSAKSPASGQLMLPRSAVSDTTASMVMVTSVLVPAHGDAAFRPGGYHTMCASPSAAIPPGKQAPVTLTFRRIAPPTTNITMCDEKGD